MIVVEKLTKQFKGQVVLNGIDLKIEEGEVVAIIGPSGSGKTTFLRCLNFLEEPTSGRIKVGDIEIDGSRPLSQQQGVVRRLRQQVGFVFQNFNLFPHRTALENVTEGPIVVKKRRVPMPRPWVASYWQRSGWPARKTLIRGACPVASNSAWRLPGRWRWNLR